MASEILAGIGSAGESGTFVQGDAKNYLVRGFLPTIGIECHVQLSTKTKLFSRTDNDARGAEPNSEVSVIDYGLPGMLPMLNREAVRFAARAGRALNAKIANLSRFDRKHYFYPDLPKGYQITQMFAPIILGGRVDLPPRKDPKTGQITSGESVRIHHAHLEEDAGKLTHFDDYSLVDLNRAGTPLIEIVGEPDIHSAAEARAYCEELHLLMTYAKVTLGDLYNGNMRFDVNISVARPGEKLGKRTELKNLNSFHSVEKAVEFEVGRQIDLIEDGGEVEQETRGWNEARGQTLSQRGKEDAQDYRYMPDADIPPIVLTDAEIAEMQKDFPVMPGEFRAKFAALKVDDSVVKVLLSNPNVANLISEILDKAGADAARRIANLFASSLPDDDQSETTDSLRNNTSDGRLVLPPAENLIALAEMLDKSEISSTAGKEIFAELLKNPETDPREFAKAKNLIQVSDEGALSKIVAEVLVRPECQKAVNDFKAGNDKVIGFLVGQVMKASKGQANPALAQKLIRQQLK
ncbi:MAG: Asp-tRNA(Asn)/Glu-tRNA(Gln) amidotransferase subunit GatB [Candidatus Nomurabacteria bacterium]|jgi:aspartyl-tRNA(Asn)/glutamyl-tRNA(Gln) amidotransferase subunit B|nr:Asp-tRNA(Asn)/Glu-tRNA(Gln) amidotransferase subunit GatB [Candidatus Nomurabacteria bacterium]